MQIDFANVAMANAMHTTFCELCVMRSLGGVNCVAIDIDGFEFGICDAVGLFLFCDLPVLIHVDCGEIFTLEF